MDYNFQNQKDQQAEQNFNAQNSNTQNGNNFYYKQEPQMPQKRKSGFWTFIFACIPGAGLMYLGLMKKGVSMMLMFFLTIALSIFVSNMSFLNVNQILIFLLPVMWFYSFFETMHTRNLPKEKFELIKDEFILDLSILSKVKIDFSDKLKKIIGIVLVWCGLGIVGKTVIQKLVFENDALSDAFKNLVSNIYYSLGDVLLGLIIIALGLLLIFRKKKNLDEEIKTELDELQAKQKIEAKEVNSND